MKDISDALDLIATARDALLNDLLPQLRRDQRYTALMIANALAIAQREQRSNTDVTRDEIRHLAQLLAECGIAVVPSSSDASADKLTVLRRTLCGAIRGGRLGDTSHSAALIRYLERTTTDWVAISSPKASRTEAAD